MALPKKVYGVKTAYLAPFSDVHGVDHRHPKSRKNVAPQSEMSNLRRLQLQLQLISDQGDKFRIRGFSLGIADGIAEKSLQSIQISSVPGHFDGMADGTLHSGRGGLECFRHLGVEYLGDGIRVPDGPRRGYQEPPQNKRFFGVVYCFLCWSMHRCFIGLVALL